MDDDDTRSQVDGEPLVLGQQLADATKAEQQRLEAGGFGDSPLPDAEYEFWRGDLSLIAPASNPLDDQIRRVCGHYALADTDQQSKIRRSISMDQFYTLINFAKRSAVFGVRQGNPDIIAGGLAAIAMIERERVDFRDILCCLGLLHHSANRAGGDADIMFRNAAALAEPEVAECFLNFLQQDAGYRDLRSSWGYDEVQTEDGMGFIGWGFKDYRPTIDLKATIVEISEGIASDSYQPAQIAVASDLPDVWIGAQSNPKAQRLLSSIRAVATLNASLRPDKYADHASQQFTVFLVEAENEKDAQALCQLAEATQSPAHSTLALAQGKLFCLVIARSFMLGVDTFETDESLSRFSNGLTEVLEKHAGSRER
jgi:hypothetical protein